MRYKSFRIRNFKGIKDTTVSFDGIGGASVFAFVGLNESDKTTILEAIHSFSPDAATSELLGGSEGSGVPFKVRVPRHQLSTFTGDVSVLAIVSLTQADKKKIAHVLEEENELLIDIENMPDDLVLERQQTFKDGDFFKSYYTLLTELKVKSKKQKKWRESTREEDTTLRDVVNRFIPIIAYFPTFVFNFPETIFLTDRGGDVDRFYRSVFQDILDYDRRGHTIEKDIVRRLRGPDKLTPWQAFLSNWTEHDDKAKIQHVIDRASAAVTKLVFGRWNQIFGEDTRGKEVVISQEVVEGEIENQQGTKTKTQEHDLYIKFQIRDGTRRFNVNDRSLGFRWFFAFMLFTQFRVARASSRPLLFLFDEPASNLHAAAQQKLVDCFPEIAKDEHALAYTTHSHYMIEPKWLEQTFIVTNRADAPVSSVLDDISLDDESLDIRATSYRSFVNNHPSQTTYFQPILDRLDVVPSRFDMLRPSIVLEGKSDYYVLRYAVEALGQEELPLLPGLGAGTFGAMAALHVGWNLNFLFVLDGDRQGKIEKERYAREYGVPITRLCTLSELDPSVTTIETLLDDEALRVVQTELRTASKLNKAQVCRFFQERLASNNVTQVSPVFTQRSANILAQLKAKLASQAPTVPRANL